MKTCHPTNRRRGRVKALVDEVATGGLAKWLAPRLALDAAQIATLLASCVQYDIAGLVGPRTQSLDVMRAN
jgi:hypothetical protein